ncbi:MAG: non-canonical purine NTP pyrophosphatase [bacterium]
MQLLFLTSNPNKLKEAQDILGDNIQVIGQNLELDEIQAVGAEKVIEHKTAQAKKALGGKKFFVEDTALYLGKNKEVGALIKFFDNQRIVKAYENEPAEAVCVIGLSDGKIFKGIIKGKIVTSKGKHGFGWDPIFQPEGYNKTFAQMTPEEKNNLSMRKIALEKLRKYLLR